jgi:enoyl-CoA hydratase
VTVSDAPRGVRLEREERIATITLDRPELFNRIDKDVHGELESVFNQVAGMTEIRAVVFAASGPVFSAGGDFDFILSQHEKADRNTMINEAISFFAAFLSIPCPVVVALQGDVVGVGSSLVLSADAIVSHPNARISDPHVTVGLVAGDGGCVAWPMRAIDAHRVGLISDLVGTPEEVLPAACALAARISALPPVAVQGTKLALNHLIRQRLAEVGELAAALEYDSLKTEDLTEALAAIRERRDPQYRGS